MSNLIKKLLLDDTGIFSALNSDHYHVPTGQAMWRHGAHNYRVTSNVVLRGSPRKDGPTFIGGISEFAEALTEFRFDAEFVDFMGSQLTPTGQRVFDPEYLKGLQGLPFDVRFFSMLDGDVAFPNGPIGRFQDADPIHVKWLDTALCGLARLGSMLLTKAARMTYACGEGVKTPFGDKVVWIDNAMRRPADVLGLLTAKYTRMGGAGGSSNMRAAHDVHFDSKGTMDHFYVMTMMALWFKQHPDADPRDPNAIHEAQRFAFRAFIQEFPGGGIILIDTIDVDFGLEDAMIVFKELNVRQYGVRVDSGAKLGTLTMHVRDVLDANGFQGIYIALSGGMTARKVLNLRRQGVNFQSVGVGEYFQFNNEVLGNQAEPKVNVEMVAKVATFGDADGEPSLILSKLSELTEKSSRGGVLDRVRLLKQEGDKMVFDGDIEVDLLRGDPGMTSLTKGIASLDVDTIGQRERVRHFAAGTPCVRPIREISRGAELIIDRNELSSMAAGEARFWNAYNSIPSGAKELTRDEDTPGYAAGVEYNHFESFQRMVRFNTSVARRDS